jgi:hypothetical protein
MKRYLSILFIASLIFTVGCLPKNDDYSTNDTSRVLPSPDWQLSQAPFRLL